MVSKTLIWVAKADPALYNIVSGKSRLNIQASGITIVLTAVLASLSAGFALYSVFDHTLVSVCGGLLWGVVIMMIDREIVGSRSKKSALLRLPLAIVIGAIVATPLELQLFSGRIQEKLRQNEVLANEEGFAAVKEAHSDLQGRYKEIDSEIKMHRDEIKRYTALMEAEVVGRVLNGATGIAGYGPAYDAAKSAKEESIRLLEMATNSKKELDKTAQYEMSFAKDVFEKEKTSKAADLLAKYEALSELKAESDDISAMAHMVFLLFVLIEAMPALLKLFQDEDDYTALLKAQSSFNKHRIYSVHNEVNESVTADPLGAPQKAFLAEINRVPLAG